MAVRLETLAALEHLVVQVVVVDSITRLERLELLIKDLRVEIIRPTTVAVVVLGLSVTTLRHLAAETVALEFPPL